MSKQAEIDYLKNIGPAATRQAADKPFADADCGAYLMELGAILRLLPPPPARILDLGCGTGWTSCFLARRGYVVVGVDVSDDMIFHANQNLDRYGAAARFIAGDFEQIDFDAEFDAALFFDSLHHSLSEESALRCACRALKPGGVCIASEPGIGHARHPVTREVVRRFQVTERDMEPKRIIGAGRKVGFRRFQVYPHTRPISDLVYGPSRHRGLLRWLSELHRTVRLGWLILVQKHSSGIVVMSK